ncbi:hypothetical protein FS320_15810 [Microvirga tunisiensis]|uniref:XdhC Rossmann domain-containing protein n=1 Tax=Microvirga tunisiensis TaxID=2108360 RepID=A0A5N7MIC2_9HYPH|nr:XdhC family protein [Microvirga tunisiensis]MPR08406.1 hypothetical protein [Microvirga tunisiensis]MPR26643.1 hypothetical protein [Microvirga tunisiensis]
MRSDCFHIGALGARKSHTQRLERLVAMGFTDADLAHLHVSAGIRIGAVSPPRSLRSFDTPDELETLAT